MKVVVIGITGRIGKRVGRLLADRGHTVLGLNRRAHRVAHVLGSHSFETAVVDALDEASTSAAIAGADVVVLATSPTRENPDEFLAQTCNVLQGALAANARVIAVSGSYALNAPDGRPMLEASPPNVYFTQLESVYPQQVTMVRQFANAHPDFEWLLVAPPPETYPYGSGDGEVVAQEGVLVVTNPASLAFKETSKLSFEDLAGFIVDQAETPTWHNALISVAYGKETA